MVNKQEISKALKEIVQDVVDYKYVALCSNFESNTHLENELGLDSLDMCEVIMKLEDYFGFRMMPDDDEEFSKMNHTVGNIVDFVYRILSK